MKTVGLIVLAVMAVLVGAPVLTAVALMAVGAPAAGEVIRAQPCVGNPVSQHWRAPFEQEYTIATEFGQSRQTGGPPLKGVDLLSAQQPGQVVAAAPGVVTSTATQDSGAKTIEIDHAHGISTRYVHLGQIREGLTDGSEVSIGQPLGTEGGTGTTAGTLLHFQVLVQDVPTDPVQFMAERGTPLNGTEADQWVALDVGDKVLEGGVGFELPEPGEPRKDSLTNPALSVPADIEALYEQAGEDYGIPGTLLAGIGMTESAHGRNTAESPVGALGLMQFMPETFAAFGVDGDGDGIADIRNDADSIFSAANYLTISGVQNGPDGVREALYAYNQADWYVNDVLFYAHEYGGGIVIGDPIICDDPVNPGNPELPPLTNERIERMFARAQLELGDPYVLGAEGPNAWDCSSFSRMAFAEIGITMPRTARAQRDWLASGNGFRVPLGKERPGDLVFWDSYRGPNEIGHVMIVWDPANMSTIEAKIPRVSHGDYTAGVDKNIFEIWRVGNIADDPEGVT